MANEKKHYYSYRDDELMATLRKDLYRYDRDTRVYGVVHAFDCEENKFYITEYIIASPPPLPAVIDTRSMNTYFEAMTNHEKELEKLVGLVVVPCTLGELSRWLSMIAEPENKGFEFRDAFICKSVVSLR